MNKRIRKKKNKQQLIHAMTGLVEIAGRMEEQGQAAAKKYAALYMNWYEQKQAHLERR